MEWFVTLREKLEALPRANVGDTTYGRESTTMLIQFEPVYEGQVNYILEEIYEYIKEAVQSGKNSNHLLVNYFTRETQVIKTQSETANG